MLKIQDKKQTLYLRFIAAAAITIVHAAEIDNILFTFIFSGSFWVSFFFYSAGYGLQSKLEREKENYLKGFLRKRICAVYVPFLFSNLMFLFFYWWYNRELEDPIKQFLGIKLSYNTIMWYVVEIMCIYLLYWLINMIGGYGKHIFIWLIIYVCFILVCYIFNIPMYWYISTFMFVVGIEDNIFTAIVKKCSGNWLNMGILFGILFGIYIEIVKTPFYDKILVLDFLPKTFYQIALWLILEFGAVILIASVAERITSVPRWMQSMGEYSYEMYLWHPLCIMIVKEMGIDKIWRSVIVLSATIVISIMAHKVNTFGSARVGGK